MNSMFSAFDALFVEVMGKNLMASSFNATATATAKPAATQTQTEKKENASTNKMGLVQKTPRFALELDGLHCFETIVRS
ncbi:hypothetical protein EUTSA_v10009241mg [Eutrema salsugineum]|uniref:Uncharacterized protein n=1 Tax=Eutrema salsugineum TaxID=72664 RepID=V4KU20_EUTSA|nr:uncharacterized protein LOC18991754 [Eutrema salsugineum]ESQ33492.1 hypothetical protein EUTSA_v10009241mg [Eutrema salsugineum]